MSELDAIAAIRAALNRVIDDYDGAGINAETTKQVSAALTASNVLVLLRAHDEAAVAAPAVSDTTRLEWFLRSRSDMPPTIEAWRAAVDAAMKP